MPSSPYVKQPPQYSHCLLRNAKHGKKMEFYTFVLLKYLTKIFKKLKLSLTEFCMYMAQVDTQNSVNSIKKALFTILRVI